MMKKLFCTLLAALMLLSVSAFAAEDLLIAPAPETDTNILSYEDALTLPSYAIEPFQWGCGTGIVTGYADGYLRHSNPVTRAQFVAFLYRLAQYKELDVSAGEDTNILSFDDAFTIPTYAVVPFQWACAMDIVDSEKPALDHAAALTRAETVTLLYRFAVAYGYDVSVGEDTNILSYEDAFTIPEESIPAVQWACGEGILNGYADGYLRHDSTLTRAHAVAFLYRFSK